MSDKATEIRDFKKTMEALSVRDFQNFGLHQIAYVRAVTEKGKTQYGIYAADGEVISVVPTKDKAVGAIIQNDLEPITLQ